MRFFSSSPACKELGVRHTAGVSDLSGAGVSLVTQGGPLQQVWPFCTGSAVGGAGVPALPLAWDAGLGTSPNLGRSVETVSRAGYLLEGTVVTELGRG